MTYSDPRTVCSPWTTADKLCCAGDQEVDDCATGDPVALVYKWTDDELILAISNYLYAQTCYRYPGECPVTVWPCPACNCGCHPCACGTWSILELPTDYPVLSVDEVRFDGVAIDPSTYRLDQSKYLVKMDGQRWPSCNSFGLPNTNAIEIQVDMTVGRQVPIELQIAAADLVCEIKKACDNSADCDLPPHVRGVIRRGVEIQIDDITSLFKDGLTGIPTVDMAIKIHGCTYHGTLFDPLSDFKGYGVSS